MKYYIKEGFSSFFSNGLMSLASVIIMAACLAMLGLYIIFSSNINYITEQFASRYEIQVFVDKQAAGKNIDALGERIALFDNVASVTFVSKEEALEIVRAKFDKSSSALDGLDKDNPFRDSFTVTVDDLEKINATIDEIRALPLVAKVNNNKETLDNLMGFTEVVRSISLWIMLFLAVIAIFIISNTIRITVASRSREITIMKFVGATDLFIRTPFIIEGMLIAGIATIIAIVSLTQLYAAFATGYRGLFGAEMQIQDIRQISGLLSLSLAAMSLVLSGIGCAITIGKYLKV